MTAAIQLITFYCIQPLEGSQDTPFHHLHPVMSNEPFNSQYFPSQYIYLFFYTFYTFQTGLHSSGFETWKD